MLMLHCRVHAALLACRAHCRAEFYLPIVLVVMAALLLSSAHVISVVRSTCTSQTHPPSQKLSSVVVSALYGRQRRCFSVRGALAVCVAVAHAGIQEAPRGSQEAPKYHFDDPL